MDDFIFDPSLALYLPLYLLDGGSFGDKSAYGHLCTATDSIWQPNGHYFNGTSATISPADLPAPNSRDITMEIWLKTSAGLGGCWILNHFESSSDEWGIDGSATAIRINDDIDNAGAVLYSQTITAGNWYHAVAVLKNLENLLYLNGNLVGSGTSASDGWDSFGGNLYIGQRGNASAWFGGTIGEVRIYSRALTPIEIQNNYLATKWRYR